MPSATQPGYSMVSPSTKKRRRESDGEVQKQFNTTFEASQNLLSAINNERLVIPSNRGSASLFSVPRKAIPVSLSKKLRLVEDSHEPNNNYHHHHTHPSTLSQAHQSHFSHAHPELASAPPRTNTSILLSPCHICHRKPTKKSDLDSFADCTGCSERTCFICLRECQGWPPVHDNGSSNQATSEVEGDLSASFTMQDADDEEASPNHNHNHTDKTASTQRPEQKQKKGEGGEGGWNASGHRGVICSRCCVEQGSEGDVVCLGCLAGMKGS
ncbi:hypothetical protein GGR51DRAFT_472635 [Nemania sp. FL0031]|nr:hypothetical protein GGR51DRAFT_472635 [Nemania sp. FL0031]